MGNPAVPGTRHLEPQGEVPDFPDVEVFSVREQQRSVALQFAITVAQFSGVVEGATTDDAAKGVVSMAKEFYDFLAG